MYLGNEVDEKGRITDKLVGYPGDGHMLTIGPTRSGKSRRLLIPNLLYEFDRSALVVDVKGELAANTAAHREAKGGKVFALDPFGALDAAGVNVPVVGFNPMARLDPEDDMFVDDTMVLAEALIQVSPHDQNPHFAESAQDVIAALIMWVKWRRREQANLMVVRQLICQPVQILTDLAHTARKANAPAPILQKLSKFMAPAKDNRELDGVLSTAQTQTRFLDSPGIVRSLSAGDVDFAALKRESITIYLVLPPAQLVSHAKWLRLVISSAMLAMQRSGLAPSDRKSVLFLLDEFPQLGRLEAIETAVSLNAGFGVKVWAAVQHLGQLKELYKDNWETFLSAGCVTTFAPRDVFTRDHLTKLIGTGSKIIPTITTSSDGQTSIGRTIQKDDLIAPYDWRRMVLGDQFAFIPTANGQIIKRVHSYDFSTMSTAGPVLLPTFAANARREVPPIGWTGVRAN